MNKCVFLDRDGVLNVDNPNYTYEVSNFHIVPGVPEALRLLKQQGFYLIVVTNQSGIAQGLYSIDQMKACHNHLQEQCGNVIDYFYFSPYHPSVTNSLLRKPGKLMFEKAIAKFNIDVSISWMVGDRGRDLVPARQLGMKTIQVGDEVEPENAGDYKVEDLMGGVGVILSKN